MYQDTEDPRHTGVNSWQQGGYKESILIDINYTEMGIICEWKYSDVMDYYLRLSHGVLRKYSVG